MTNDECRKAIEHLATLKILYDVGNECWRRGTAKKAVHIGVIDVLFAATHLSVDDLESLAEYERQQTKPKKSRKPAKPLEQTKQAKGLKESEVRSLDRETSDERAKRWGLPVTPKKRGGE